MQRVRSLNSTAYRPSSGGGGSSNAIRIFTLMIIVILVLLVIVGRLFQLQILKHDEYIATAEDQHFGAIDLPAKRGEILVQDKKSGEMFKLATNTTLDLVYVDPMVAEDKAGIAKNLAPLLFTRGEYESCLEDTKLCPYNVVQETQVDEFLQTEVLWSLDPNEPKMINTLKDDDERVKSYDQMVSEVEQDILQKISKTEVDFVVLRRDAEEDLMAEIINERLAGVFVDKERFLIYADPTLIPEGRLNLTAKALAGHLDEQVTELEKKMARRKVRYTFLKNKISPRVSQEIKALKFKGVVLLPEHWRFYPEGGLAANLVGFINRENEGQYGVEGYFNAELEGKKGAIYAESDPFGRQITVGEGQIVNAVDGDKIVLTIDRIVQKKVEEVLAESVERFRADSGQVIIMNPFTGAIVAMANYPSFNPNVYAESYTLKSLTQKEVTENTYPTTPLFKKDDKGRYVPIEKGDEENALIEKFAYENRLGPGTFKNKVVSEYYEPGSVFKPLVMAIALDAKEVEPQTTFDDDGPLQIDEFEIKNSDNNYHGITNMTEVLEKSLNTGMSFVAKEVGSKLMHSYLDRFGFGEYTNIRLEGETKGQLDYYSRWSRAQLLTTSFGQGIVVTPLQMVAAWAAMANGGKLIQPYIIDSIIRENEVIKSEPQVIHRVMSEETSSIITSMLVSVVRRGHGRPADIPGYLIAGKTGTAQVAGPNGKYLTGEGSTITSFAGYFPALQPQFVMLVKFDRPRIGENTWGSTTAAPTFGTIAQFLIEHYNIQPN